jgi:hypothetical protein
MLVGKMEFGKRESYFANNLSCSGFPVLHKTEGLFLRICSKCLAFAVT